LLPVLTEPRRELSMCRVVLSRSRPHLFVCLPQPIRLKSRMSGEPSELEKFVKEFLKKIMVDRSISKGIQALSTRGLQASPLIGCRSSRVNPVTEK
jgi:hypothetical protein